MNAHVFQHCFTGAQMFIFHCNDEIQARSKFIDIVRNDAEWFYLGIKHVTI